MDETNWEVMAEHEWFDILVDRENLKLEIVFKDEEMAKEYVKARILQQIEDDVRIGVDVLNEETFEKVKNATAKALMEMGLIE